jgi:hypothetical protein
MDEAPRKPVGMSDVSFVLPQPINTDDVMQTKSWSLICGKSQI